MFELVTLKSGIKSLRKIENGETFHPGIGPVAEAKILHITQQRLVERGNQVDKLIIWDVGLGAAANAIAAIEALRGMSTEVELHSFDQSLSPIEFASAHAKELEYPLPHQGSIEKLLTEGVVSLRPGMKWILHLGDFRDEMLNQKLPSPHSVFYDPYSPTTNQEMWNLEHFQNLYHRLDPGTPCLLSNYTRSTRVRVTWLLAGFYVGIGVTIGQKEETTLASNHRSMIETPLTRSWLNRVKISHSASPHREEAHCGSPISEEDYQTLLEHPQFK